MRKIILLLLLLPLITMAQPCQAPVSQFQFQQKFNEIAMQKTDMNKLPMASAFAKNQCLHSMQVRQIAALFADDSYRLEFCKTAYVTAMDKQNFYDVYDAFFTYGAIFRLDDFIKSVKPVTPPPPPPPASAYPNIPYPSVANYMGKTGCLLPIADADFDLLAKNIEKYKPEERHMAAKEFAFTYCLSMGQAMKLSSFIQMEASRLALMKDVFHKTYDLENFNYAEAVFSHVPYKTDWKAFCITYLNSLNAPPPPAETPCVITPQEMPGFKQTVEKEMSANTKLQVAKQIISSKKCFSSAQIREMVLLMSFESGKLELAKFAFDYCLDKDNYYLINDAFSFSSSKNELIKYTKSKQK